MKKNILLFVILLLKSYDNGAFADTCEDLANGVDRDYEMEEVNPCYACEWHKIVIDSRQSNPPLTAPFTEAEMSRIGNPNEAWCGADNGDEYLQIDFFEKIKIAGVMVQGLNITESWVTTFKIAFTGGEKFSFLKNEEREVKVFQGNIDGSGEKQIKFPIPVKATSIRIYPVTNHEEACMNVDVYACEEQVVQKKLQAMPSLFTGQFNGWTCKVDVLNDCTTNCLDFKKDMYGCDTCECKDMQIGQMFEADIQLTDLTKEAVKITFGLEDRTFETGVYKAASKLVPKWTDYKSGSKFLIPYTYGSGLSSRAPAAIQSAIRELSSKTCIQLVRRTNQPYYINFRRGGGCSSPVGKQSRGNQVSIGYGCEHSGTVVHEILHSLGFWHEQSRPDRDSYVRIVSYNIQQGMAYNFQKRRQHEIDSFGSPYDLNSVMHYHGTAFSRNGQATIVDKYGKTVSGQRNGLSAEDVKQINKMYQCSNTGTGQTTSTRSPTTVKPTGTCIDENKTCGYWAGIGECRKNPGYMLHKCKKSCIVCTGGGSTCKDKHSNCRGWIGYCRSSSYSAYMSLNCPSTCKKC